MPASFTYRWACFSSGSRRRDAAQIDLVPGYIPDGPDTILIQGPIEEGDDHIFYSLSQQTERAAVYLESPGGDVRTGLSIGSEIAIRGFTTLVLDGSGCHSICAVIWVSGVRRYMSPAADISVHAAYRIERGTDGAQTYSESGMANASLGAYLNEIGLSLPAIEYFTVARPNEPMRPITPAIAQMLDIDVFIQDGPAVTSPADRPTPGRIARQVTDYGGMMANCPNLFGVSEDYYNSFMRSTLKSGHDIFGGEVFAENLGLHTENVKLSVASEGIIRWCIKAEGRLRADNLPTGIDGPSFDCSRATTATDTALCSSADLWALDRAMAALYFHYRNGTTGEVAASFLATQRSWLKRRDECGGDVVCLSERYASRLHDFGA